MKISIFILFLLSALCVQGQTLLQRDTSQSVMRMPCPGSPIVYDHQGNVYKTVQIGSQCWMAENMRCTTSPTRRTWQYNPVFTEANPAFNAYYYIQLDLSVDEDHENILYNWSAATEQDYTTPMESCSKRIKGICPAGWHIPASEEWSTLIATLGGTTVAGGVMRCPSVLWNTPTAVESTESGFSALPTGIYTEEGLMYADFYANFWSATSFDTQHAWYCSIFSNNTHSYCCLDYKCYGCSVRCLKD